MSEGCQDGLGARDGRDIAKRVGLDKTPWVNKQQTNKQIDKRVEAALIKQKKLNQQSTQATKQSNKPCRFNGKANAFFRLCQGKNLVHPR